MRKAPLTTRSVPLRLSSAQRRHLAEMVGPTGSTLYWHPANQGERACAYTLRKKGLLEGSTVSYGDAFYLSDEGLRVALELRAATA